MLKAKIKNLTFFNSLKKCFLDLPAFGLDISETKIKLIQIQKNKQKRPEIVYYRDIKLADGIIQDGNIKKPEALIEEIKKIKEAHADTQDGNLLSCDVVSVLPENKTFIKLLKIKNAPRENIIDEIRKKIVNHIPLPPESLYIDWQKIDNMVAKKGKINVLVGAAPREIVDSYVKIFEGSGFNLIALEIEAIAIARTIIKEPSDSAAKIIIDIGANRTGLIVYDNNTIQLTVSLPISGNQITKTIAETIKLNADQAEKAKIICGFDDKKCKGAMKKILYSVLEELNIKINHTIDFYANHFPESNPVSEIILCGGGANFIGIEKIMEEKIKMPVVLADPMIGITISESIPAFGAERARLFTTAIGLGLRDVMENNNKL